MASAAAVPVRVPAALAARGLAAFVFVTCASALWLGEDVMGVVRGVTGAPAVCSFRARTGLPCVGCGGTHAFGEASRGRFASAAGANVLGAAVAVGAWLLLGASVWSLAAGRLNPLLRTLLALAVLLPVALLGCAAAWLRSLPSGALPGP